MKDDLRAACIRLINVADQYEEMGRSLPITGGSDALHEIRRILETHDVTPETARKTGDEIDLGI